MVSGSQSGIWFFEEQKTTLRDRTRLKSFIRRMFRFYKKDFESLNIVFCSDRRLLEVNREYLQHDYFTDIITFELSVPGAPVMAEIYISVDRVRDNARKMEESIKQELHRVIFHGVLHLCGFTDKTVSAKAAMSKAEDLWLAKYF